MAQQYSHSPDKSIWTSLSLLWDGIYNVDHLGKIIMPPVHPVDAQLARYDCTKHSLKFNLDSWTQIERGPNPIGKNIAVRIGLDFDSATSGVEVEFRPYEQNLIIPIQICNIEKVNTLLFRVYRCSHEKTRKDRLNKTGYQLGENEAHLVYQEIFNQFEINCLQQINTQKLEETHSGFSNRINNYWGVEEFANWYHHSYRIEVWVSIRQEEFAECDGIQHPVPKVGQTVHNGEDYHKYRILAHDSLNCNYNFEQSKDKFEWLSDFSRIQRFLRNKRVFFEHLRHIEDYLETRPKSELLEALEFFEDQARFPTTQAIPIGVLSSSSFNELVLRAYAIHDVGVRSLHGAFTHRFQWHGIIRLITSGYTVAITKGFYHSALELYCTARGSLFNTTNRPNAGFAIDLWRFLFDRFDKYAPTNGPQSDQFVQYPEQYEDELHYAEQFHMAILDLPQNPYVIQNYITQLGSQNGKSTPASVMISRLSNSNRAVPSKFHNWIERYLDQLSLPLGADYDGATADERLKWGCIIKSDEWLEIDTKLSSQRIHFHELTHTASKLRSFFFEAVVAVWVISELRHIPNLVPQDNPHSQTILTPISTNQPLANMIEEIALHARITRLLGQVNHDGRPLFSKMIDADGNSIECIKKTEAVLLSQQTIDTLKLASRISLKSAQADDWTIAGVPFH
jgi:hypothetical protein